MNLFGLSPAALALLAGGLAAAVLLLHLLRIRLRQVEVDTLLFLRLAGAVRQPRVLLGIPSRWLALLLALLAVLSGLLAIADPRGGFDQPSRIVLVEPATGSEGEARIAMARELAATKGLGPRGAVMAATADPVVLLRAGEPLQALRRAPPSAPSPTGTAAGLAAASSLLRSGDEIVWIGSGPVPAAVRALEDRALQPAEKSVPVRSLGAPGQVNGALQAVEWRRLDGGEFALAVTTVGPAGCRLTVSAGANELARAEVAHAVATTELGPFRASGTVALELAAAGGVHRVELAVPAAEPCRVHVEGDVGGPVASALRALIAVDANFAAASGAADARVVVAAADADDARPRLVVHEGDGSGARLARLAPGSPVDLSLRDREQREARALPELAGIVPWVEDVMQRAVLAGAREDQGRLRVHIVRWLLEPETHGDVPLLLRESLLQLAGCPGARVAVVGVPLAVPAGFIGTRGALPEHGSLRVLADRSGTFTLDAVPGPLAVQAVDASSTSLVAAVLAGDAVAPQPESMAGALILAPWLLALLALVLVLDAIWFHRGRLP